MKFTHVCEAMEEGWPRAKRRIDWEGYIKIEYNIKGATGKQKINQTIQNKCSI